MSHIPLFAVIWRAHTTTAALSPSHHIHHPHPSPDTSLFSPTSSSSYASENVYHLTTFNFISAKLKMYCFLWILFCCLFILWLFYILVAFAEKSRVIWRFSGWHRALHLMSGNLWLWMRQSRGGERELKPVLTITISALQICAGAAILWNYFCSAFHWRVSIALGLRKGWCNCIYK